MIICQHEKHENHFTVILEDEICDDVHNRTEIELFESAISRSFIASDCECNDREQVLCDLILKGFTAMS